MRENGQVLVVVNAVTVWNECELDAYATISLCI